MDSLNRSRVTRASGEQVWVLSNRSRFPQSPQPVHQRQLACLSDSASSGPIGAAIGGRIAISQLLVGIFQGCGQTCVEASNIANQVEPALQQNLAAYLASPVRTVSMQAAAINNFKQHGMRSLKRVAIHRFNRPAKIASRIANRAPALTRRRRAVGRRGPMGLARTLIQERMALARLAGIGGSVITIPSPMILA